VTYPNGSGYKGEFQRCKFHRKGIFMSKSSGGLTYAGLSKQGYVSGVAVIKHLKQVKIKNKYIAQK